MQYTPIFSPKSHGLNDCVLIPRAQGSAAQKERLIQTSEETCCFILSLSDTPCMN